MKLTGLLAAVLLAAAPVSAETLVRLERPEPYDLQLVGIELPRAARLDIEAVGVWERGHGSWSWPSWGPQRDDQLAVYAWVLDSRTREPVWALRARDSSRESKTLRRGEGSVQVGPGRYEVYLFSGYQNPDRFVEQHDPTLWERLVGIVHRTRSDVMDDLEQCHITISTDDLTSAQVERFEVTGQMPGALVRLAGLGDSELAVDGFALARPMALRIYTLLEDSDLGASPSDYGWIVTADTRELVWHPRRVLSRPAGGGKKNRLIDTELKLESGRYLVYYGTDDSHAYGSFNVNPPVDPLNWGLTLLPGEGFDASAFETFDAPIEPALIDFTEAGDDAFLEQPFRLRRAGALHVRALGEYIEDDDTFVDGAWITDAASGRTVWEMTRENTLGGGGASKNRRFDGIVRLDGDDYVLHYASDGSHAYPDWNSAAPFEPQAWGVTVRPGPGFDSRQFDELTVSQWLEAGGVMVRLVRAGDDARLRQQFTLDRPMTLRIYALGEGGSGEMYDYGYIVDDHGRRVWEMSFERTRHAGGADKNRVVVEQVSLEPGSYEAVYVTDGSHSFERWNARRPRDAASWGLTIRRAEP